MRHPSLVTAVYPFELHHSVAHHLHKILLVDPCFFSVLKLWATYKSFLMFNLNSFELSILINYYVVLAVIEVFFTSMGCERTRRFHYLTPITSTFGSASDFPGTKSFYAVIASRKVSSCLRLVKINSSSYMRMILFPRLRLILISKGPAYYNRYVCHCCSIMNVHIPSCI